MCANEGDNARAFKISLPPSLSFSRGKLFLSRGTRRRVSHTCPRDDKRAFVHYFIGVKRTTPFSKMLSLRIEPSRIVARSFPNPPLSLSLSLVGPRMWETTILDPRGRRRRDNRNRDPRGGYLSPGRRLQPSK